MIAGRFYNVSIDFFLMLAINGHLTRNLFDDN